MSYAKGKHMATIKFSNEEMESNPFWNGFYPLVCKKLGYEWDKVESLDCTEIEIAENIEQKWFEKANEIGAQNWELGMQLACSGPKVGIDIPNNTIMVSDRFVKIA